MAPKKTSQEQRNEMKAGARQAAASGNLSQQQVRQLKSAGVNTANIQNIRQTNRQAAAASAPAASMQITQPNGNPIVTQAPARPSHVQPSYVDAGSGRSVNTRFVPGAMMPGQAGYDPATGGGVWVAGEGPDEDIRAWYRSADPWNTAIDKAISSSGKDASAFTLEGLYGSPMPSTASSASTTTSEKTKSPPRATKNLTQSIRAMGERGLAKSELSSIMESTGKSGADFVKRLDKINENLAAKGKTGINLNSGAANMLIRQSRRDPFAVNTMFSPSSFGPGKISSALQEMMGKRASGGYINPISGKQSFTPGEEPKFMKGGTAIRPGGRETVRGFGKQYTAPGKRNKAPNDTVLEKTVIKNPVGGDGYTPNRTQGTQGTQETVLPEVEEKTKDETPSVFDGISADLAIANWAPGYRAARSSRQKAGRKAQGLGQKKVAPQSNVLGY